MTEQDYIIVTNRVKISAALNLVRDVLDGDEYGISDAELMSLATTLRRIETRLFDITPELTE